MKTVWCVLYQCRYYDDYYYCYWMAFILECTSKRHVKLNASGLIAFIVHCNFFSPRIPIMVWLLSISFSSVVQKQIWSFIFYFILLLNESHVKCFKYYHTIAAKVANILESFMGKYFFRNIVECGRKWTILTHWLLLQTHTTNGISWKLI